MRSLFLCAICVLCSSLNALTDCCHCLHRTRACDTLDSSPEPAMNMNFNFSYLSPNRHRSRSHVRSNVSSLARNLSSRHLFNRTKGLYKNVKRRFSSVPPSPSDVDEEVAHDSALAAALVRPLADNAFNASVYDKITVSEAPVGRLLLSDNHKQIDSEFGGAQPPVVLRHCSSYESIEDSGCGSSMSLLSPSLHRWLTSLTLL